jgi:hypothetical protein
MGGTADETSAGDAIEVTPEMIEAGISAIPKWKENYALRCGPTSARLRPQLELRTNMTPGRLLETTT